MSALLIPSAAAWPTPNLLGRPRRAVLHGGKGTSVSGRCRCSLVPDVLIARGIDARDSGGPMTANSNFKRRVRARAAKTGESYTAALRHFRTAPRGEPMPENTPMRLSVAQLTVQPDPGDTAAVRDSGALIRSLMRDAHAAGARLLHLPEGALACPSKRIMSSTGPDDVGPADWNRADWTALADELQAIAVLAAELRLWTVLG